MLDKFQKEIVTSEEKNILVVASPGSGKTTVIINRAGYLINEKGIDPKSIIIITFTKAAAMNMKIRFKALFPGVEEPFFGTFHSLFYSILKEQRGKINIISNTESHYVLEKTIKKYMDEISEERITDILNYISAYKTGFKTLEQLEEMININILNKCFKEYEEYKNHKGLLDFDDLQIKVFDLFSREIKILRLYNGRFTSLLVDEFQDCDSMQIDILKKLGRGNSIFAVGDEDQCIYGFRGARPDFMVSFDNNFEGGVKKFLTSNYRSVKNIVEISGALIKNNKIRNVKEFSAVNTKAGHICCERYPEDRKQGEQIAGRIIEEVKKGNTKYCDNAVLYRTNIEARSLIDSFIRNKVPFRLLDKTYNFYNHFICRDLLSYINLSEDITKRSDFKRIINKPFRYISKINIEKLNNYKFKEDCFEIICKIPSLPFFQYRELLNLRKAILKIKNLKTIEIIEYIQLKLNYGKYLEEYCGKNNIDKCDMEEIIDEFNEALCTFDNTREFLDHINKVGENLCKTDNISSDTVVISTIHGVKGMEFKNVYIVNCVQGNLPYCRGERVNDIEEERRLFYVGITRAKENLFLCLPIYIRGKAKEESPFIRECGITEILNNIDDYNVGNFVRHSVFGIGVIVNKDNVKIGIKFKDDIIRDFDIDKLIRHNLLKKMA